MGNAIANLRPMSFIGEISDDRAAPPLPEGRWYIGRKVGDGVAYCFSRGLLASAAYLCADLMLDGADLAVFALTLHEAGEGSVFTMSMGFLNQCQARIRLPLKAVDQNRWMYDREGAWLKPLCSGQRVDLNKVDRMEFKIFRMAGDTVRWCLTDFAVWPHEPPRLEDPLLPCGPLVDELGQYTLRAWAGKSGGVQEVNERLRAQYAASPTKHFPRGWSRWGGWTERRLDGTGFFRTAQADGRWWLVDPDGYVFWSTGLDCVQPHIAANATGLERALSSLPPGEALRRDKNGSLYVDYLRANFMRAFGPAKWRECWAQIVLGEMRGLGFNTVANWSEWQIAREAGMPYVRPLRENFTEMLCVFRDFPDVFSPRFDDICAMFAEQLKETRDDPAFIGYFMMNEPTWGFAQELPAEGMLFNCCFCHTRLALRDFLAKRYGGDIALAAAWGMSATLHALAEGEWHTPLTAAAKKDLADFSSLMVEHLFVGLSRACKQVDPHHLNLGIRYYTVPPPWAVAGMRAFDVFSMNCYRQRVPTTEMAAISAALQLPIIIGEWHFGALDAGLPASGIGHVLSLIHI